jgi:hypothetical protein
MINAHTFTCMHTHTHMPSPLFTSLQADCKDGTRRNSANQDTAVEGVWKGFTHGLAQPVCVAAQWSRDNHLGNARNSAQPQVRNNSAAFDTITLHSLSVTFDFLLTLTYCSFLCHITRFYSLTHARTRRIRRLGTAELLKLSLLIRFPSLFIFHSLSPTLLYCSVTTGRFRRSTP